MEWLSSVTGKPYRLLTEAEWEYAAGTGKSNLYFFGNDDAMLDQYSWYGVNAQNQAHAVGTTRKPIRSGCRICTATSPSGSRIATTTATAGAPSDGSAWTTGDCCTSGRSRRLLAVAGGESALHEPRLGTFRSRRRQHRAADRAYAVALTRQLCRTREGAPYELLEKPSKPHSSGLAIRSRAYLAWRVC